MVSNYISVLSLDSEYSQCHHQAEDDNSLLSFSPRNSKINLSCFESHGELCTSLEYNRLNRNSPVVELHNNDIRILIELYRSGPRKENSKDTFIHGR